MYIIFQHRTNGSGTKHERWQLLVCKSNNTIHVSMSEAAGQSLLILMVTWVLPSCRINTDNCSSLDDIGGVTNEAETQTLAPIAAVNRDLISRVNFN